jgi:hypothetical protein
VTSSLSTDYPFRRKSRTLQFSKLTWIGLMIVTLGWTLLLSGVSLAEIVTRMSGHAFPAITSLNMAAVTQCTILTGFGLAVLGLLQSGFSALNRFFDSVLERTAKRQDFQQSLARVEAAPPRTAPTLHAAAPVQGHKATPSAKSQSRGKIVERGLLKDRAYVLFGDGTIEIETLLGLRRFTSLREAAEFIG